MLLFTRTATLTGSPRRSMPWAIEITAYVNAHCDLDVGLWAASFGRPLGSVGWSTVVDSQTTLANETNKLLTDGGYLDLVDAAVDMIPAPGEDILREFVHYQPTGDEVPVGAIATVTSATARFERMPDAVGWGVEVAQYGEQVAGSPIAVLTDMFGQMGSISWITIQPDHEAVETARGKLLGDPGYLGRMAATKDLFIEGSGRTYQTVRLA